MWFLYFAPTLVMQDLDAKHYKRTRSVTFLTQRTRLIIYSQPIIFFNRIHQCFVTILFNGPIALFGIGDVIAISASRARLERFQLALGTQRSRATPPIAPWQMQLLLPAAYTAIALGFVDSFSAVSLHRSSVVRRILPYEPTTPALRSSISSEGSLLFVVCPSRISTHSVSR